MGGQCSLLKIMFEGKLQQDISIVNMLFLTQQVLKKGRKARKEYRGLLAHKVRSCIPLPHSHANLLLCPESCLKSFVIRRSVSVYAIYSNYRTKS